MGRFDGILLFSDFDRTLFCDGTVSRENADAIRYFQSEGGLFTVASGRSASYFEQFRHLFVPNTYQVCMNGAQIYDPFAGRYLYEGKLGHEVFPLLSRILIAHPTIERVMIHIPGDLLEYDAKDPFLHTLSPHNMPLPYKILFYVPTEESDAITQSVRALVGDDYNLSRSWINGLELLSRRDDKGQAIRRVRELLGDAVRQTVCVGDYENDEPMLRAADLAYAVDNAVPALKAIAHRITVPCEEHAIAKIISEL